MDHSLQARPVGADEREVDPTRQPDRAEAGGVAAVLGHGPVDALVGLQRAAGNAAVVEMLQRLTAPATPGRDDEEARRRAAEAQAAALAAGEAEPAGDAAPIDDPDRPHSREERAAKLEQDDPSPEEEHVEPGSGPVPIGPAPADGVGFVEGGRQSTVPFGDAQAAHLDPERDPEPHAFTAGGKTGGAVWAGGGGAGPKGNQPSGSIQNLVDPVYEAATVSPFDNANAWVEEGTGVADVTRSYVTSSPGDQGNGWWVSDKASAALGRHEQKHASASRDGYISRIQPVLDRVATSPVTGFGKTYWAKDAKAYVKQQVGWASGIKDFEDEDKQYNAPHGVVDTEDQGSSSYPRQRGPGQVSGKDFTNRLMLGSEPDPE